MPSVGRKFTPTSKKATLKYVLKISLFSPKDICFYLVYDYVNTSFLGGYLVKSTVRYSSSNCSFSLSSVALEVISSQYFSAALVSFRL